eukprot:Skav236346  [mRNA]  locus=scaffold918:83052:85145:- [translate_table: standard]
MFAANIRKRDPTLSAVRAQDFVKDLGFAAHRFESLQKPLSRIVLFWDSFLTTLVEICWQRRGQDEAKACANFLEWLTPEKCILVAMLADAGEENLQLTRLVDYQGFPVDELGLQRLTGWVRLTESIVEAEFPSFHVHHAFSCLTVTGQSIHQQNISVRRSSQLSRLARAFGIQDADSATSQLEKYRHLAVRLAADEGLDSSSAWLEAMRRVTRSWSKADVGALLPILVRLWSSGASTSGVEQSFSQAESAVKFLQLPGHVNDVMEIYGNVRSSGAANRPKRGDYGLVRESARSGGKPSITGWIRKRKLDVAEGVSCRTPMATVDMDAAVWTMGHTKEQQFSKA